jgi:signal transduction histidine kinase
MIENNEFEVLLERQSLRKVVEDCVEMLLGDAGHKKVKLDVKFDVPDHQVEIDATRVQQILLNLVSNAIKYSEANECVEVHVKYFYTEPSLDSDRLGVNISVIDHGEGILPEDVERIFTPFYRA